MDRPPLDSLVHAIEEVGYCQVPAVFPPQRTGHALALLQRWKEWTDGHLAASVPYLNQNQPMVYNLQNKDHEFLRLLFEPPLLEQLLVHFLNDPWYRAIPAGKPNYILRSYLGRSSLGELPLHIDSFIPYRGRHVIAMQAVIVLEGMDEDNGCTVVVPGSHQAGEYVDQASRKDAVPVRARAGDLIVWDSRLWHGTTRNDGGRSRWTLIATFTRWWLKQAFDLPAALPPAIFERLTPEQKAILGFCTIPFADETRGIDFKQGYEALAQTKQ
jgi:ectoine hydroxylase-related dioxygenase (phytanoyl-CoA dioxygenase family)